MAVNLFERNTLVKNGHSTGTFVVEALRYPARSEVLRRVIPPGKHTYISYNDLHIEYTKCHIAVYVYPEGASKKEKKSLMASRIRDNETLVLNYENGTVTVTPNKGNIVAMNGYVLS
jgi:hypothetical protein